MLLLHVYAPCGGVAKRATYTLAPPQGHLREEAGEKEVTAGKAGLVQQLIQADAASRRGLIQALAD
jgi:hypothetical protein